MLAASPLRDLTARQRYGLCLAGAIVLLGLLWIVGGASTGDLVPLPTNHPLAGTDVDRLASRFREAGLTGYERSGSQILVPRSRLDAFVTAMSENAARRGNWASEWERQNERLSPFSSNRDRETTREIARAKLVVDMLTQLPDIQHADVVWDEDEQRGWRESPKARATVYLKPKPDRILTLEVIRSVRQAVAGSKRNLDATDVTVMDLARQVTYDGDLPTVPGEELLPTVRSLAELYRREILQQIPELPDPSVAVWVDLPAFFAFLADHPDDASSQLSAEAPGLLRVTVDLPAAASAAEGVDPESLRNRISRLTGIGSTRDSAQQIVISRPNMAAPTPRKHVHSAWYHELALEDHWQTLAATTGCLLVLLSLYRLVRNRTRTRRDRVTSPPEFLDLTGPSRAASAVPGLLRFDDLGQLDQAALRSVYPHATPRRWAIALCGSDVRIAEHLAAALDPLDAAELHQHRDTLSPVTLGEIESSRQRIVESVQTS